MIESSLSLLLKKRSFIRIMRLASKYNMQVNN